MTWGEAPKAGPDSGRCKAGMSRIVALACVLAAWPTVLAADAGGATLGVYDGTLTYTAAAGETNHFFVRSYGNGWYEITDSVPLSLGPGCINTGFNVYACSGDIERAVFSDGDGNDDMNALEVPVPTVLQD